MSDPIAMWSRAIGKALRAQGFARIQRSAQRSDRWVLKTSSGLECDLMEKLPDVLGQLIAVHYPNERQE